MVDNYANLKTTEFKIQKILAAWKSPVKAAH